MASSTQRSYCLQLANAEQAEECLSIEQKGLDNAGLSREEYIELRRQAADTPYSSLGRRWVLVPEDDPESLNIVSVCKSFRRHVLLKLPGVPEPRRCTSYSLATVVTPPEHRRRGYAATLVRQWVEHLKANELDSTGLPELVTGDEHVTDGALGILYSAIGQYYAPFGFKTMNPSTVIWQVNGDDAVREEAAADLPDTTPLVEEDIPRLATLDEGLLLQELRDTSDDVVSMAVLDPSGHCVLAKTHACRVIARALGKADSVPHAWGAYISGSGSPDRPEAWALWGMDWFEESLKIFRLRASNAQQFRALVRASRRAATEVGAKQMDVWNIDDNLLKEAGWEGLARDRTDALSCVAWWGGNGLEEGMKWVNNQRGLYC